MEPSLKDRLEDINQLAQQLESPIYIVGGTVRDHLLGKSCSDYDFTLRNAPEIASTWAKKIQRTLVPLDETPGHETYRVVLHPNLYFDFTTLQGQTIEEDLAQRDFTINAMALPIPDFIDEKINLIDPFHGQNDLCNKNIRVLPGQIFEEDPLRLLRAFRFASTLDFNIEAQTLAQIETHRTRLKEVAQERITYEFLLLLESQLSRLDLMDSTGIIAELLPGITDLKTKPSIHSGATLWEDTRNTFKELESILLNPDHYLDKHSRLAMDYLSKNSRYALLKWSSLIHLLKTIPGFDVPEYLREFRLSNSDIQFIDQTLKFSEIMLSEVSRRSGGFRKDSTIYQFIHRSGNKLISSLLLSFAIRLGNQQDIKLFSQSIKRIFEFYTEIYLPARSSPPLLNGDILKNKFQLAPSPQFRFILEKVEEARVLGIIKTSAEAEQFARNLIT